MNDPPLFLDIPFIFAFKRVIKQGKGGVMKRLRKRQLRFEDGRNCFEG